MKLKNGLSVNCFLEITSRILKFFNLCIKYMVPMLLVISVYGPLLSPSPAVSII